MIYTVTLNPAIDYVVHIEEIITGKINRSQSEQIYCGGKGINVSLVLSALGIPSKALGFVAGFTGLAIEKGIAKQGVETDFIHLESGSSRINVKIKSGEETDLNGQGPKIPEDAVHQLYKKIDKLKDNDTLVLAGSIPASLPSDIYGKLLARVSDRKIKTVVDATKDLLLNVLKYKPFLIKPNNNELEEIFGVTLSSKGEIVVYAKKLREMGAVNVLVSMAGDGAVLIDDRGIVHWHNACKGKVKNSVGAGDSMVAGFLAGLQGGDYEYALKLGTAAGGATAFSDGLAERQAIDALFEQL